MALIITKYYPEYEMTVSRVYHPFFDDMETFMKDPGFRIDRILESPMEILKNTPDANIVEDETDANPLLEILVPDPAPEQAGPQETAAP